MAKGQSRKTREIRKPKADKPKVAATPATNSNLAMLSAINEPKKRK
jgi:hypothetical protein